MDATELGALWQDAFELWLGSQSSENTRRAYKSAWMDLTSWAGHQIKPWQITRTEIVRWSNDMLHRRALSAETVAQRLAAVSSFFVFAQRVYTYRDADGNEVALAQRNPTDGAPRPARQMYGKANPLTADQARQLLDAIPRDTTLGLRDYALILGYLATGRRNSELRQLRWGDLQVDGAKERVRYRWSGKGKTDQLDEMPVGVYYAIMDYLRAAKRLRKIRKTHYIFIPVDGDPTHPLTSAAVAYTLKKYAAAAGMDPAELHVHSLRHTLAFLLIEEAGATVDVVSSLLGHSGIQVTQVYLHRLTGHHTAAQQRVMEALRI